VVGKKPWHKFYRRLGNPRVGVHNIAKTLHMLESRPDLSHLLVAPLLIKLSWLTKFSIGTAQLIYSLGYKLESQRARVHFPADAIHFSLHHYVQTGSEAHPASFTRNTEGCFPRAEVLWV
jgi:hypothetical protein